MASPSISNPADPAHPGYEIKPILARLLLNRVRVPDCGTGEDNTGSLNALLISSEL